MERYTICSKIGEGSFSEVFKASYVGGRPIRCNSSLNCVAIKCIKTDIKKQQPAAMKQPAMIMSTEVDALRQLQPHPNIVELFDVFVDHKSQRLCIVTELMTMNLFEYIQTFTGSGAVPEEPTVRALIFQLLQALSYIHKHGMFHRDVKPENLLLAWKKADPWDRKRTLRGRAVDEARTAVIASDNSDSESETGEDNFFFNQTPNSDQIILKLGDFGSAKEIKSPQPFTEYIATRWYRAPECLKTSGLYSFPMDVWSVGCVMYELLTTKPLFPGENEAQQLRAIETFLKPRSGIGTLEQLRHLLPSFSYSGAKLLAALLTYDPLERLTADQALRHEYFDILRFPDRFIHEPVVLFKTNSTDDNVDLLCPKTPLPLEQYLTESPGKMSEISQNKIPVDRETRGHSSDKFHENSNEGLICAGAKDAHYIVPSSSCVKESRAMNVLLDTTTIVEKEMVRYDMRTDISGQSTQESSSSPQLLQYGRMTAATSNNAPTYRPRLLTISYVSPNGGPPCRLLDLREVTNKQEQIVTNKQPQAVTDKQAIRSSQTERMDDDIRAIVFKHLTTLTQMSISRKDTQAGDYPAEDVMSTNDLSVRLPPHKPMLINHQHHHIGENNCLYQTPTTRQDPKSISHSRQQKIEQTQRHLGTSTSTTSSSDDDESMDIARRRYCGLSIPCLSLGF